jgi:hypothetical protein
MLWLRKSEGTMRRMKPGHGGVQVSVDGNLIFAEALEGFDPAEIVRRVGVRRGS